MKPLIVVLLSIPLSAGAASNCKSNLLIVLDRSCSMRKPPNATETRTKWDLAVEALNKLTTDHKGQIRFGLTLFPDKLGDDCTQGAIPIAVGDDNETAIADLLAKTDIKGPCVTNIDTAMKQAKTDPALKDTDRRSVVLLITDGVQSGTCGGVARDPVTVQHIKDLYADWVPTYVVGFGGAVRPQSLEDFAQAGGVPRPGTPSYFQADSAADLDLALEAIADVVGTIEFSCIGMPCPDGRCRDPKQVCAQGFCVTPTPDGGAAADGAGGDAGDAGATGDGGSSGNVESGCSCRLAPVQRSPVGSMLALVLLLGLTVLLRRR